MRKRLLTLVLVVIGSLTLPTLVLAQSAIAGVVKDTTGAVLPGVTVEASSPVLIEKTKTATSNEAGQYRVVDLRPGTYSVTFTLNGFSTVVREGVVLEANFTAPINIEMRVGAVAESVTVTGESPIVDVQSSQRREVVTQAQIEAIPTGRNFQLMAGTVPSVSTGVFDVGGSSSMWTGGSLLTHGSLTGDSRTLIDGLVVDAMFGAGQCSCTYDNEAQTQEMAVQVSGGSAENQLSGVLVNRIPRTGGNKFSGDTVLLLANGSTQGVNLDDELRARGISTPDRLHRDYDINYSLGGPLKKDRLWFFVSGRNWAYNNYVANAFNPDGTQAVDDNNLKAFPLRLTSQVSQKNRVTALFDWASKIRGHRNLSSLVAPAAAITQKSPAQHVAQAKWTSTISNRLLFEFGVNETFNDQLYGYEPEVVIGTCHTAFTLCPPGTSYGTIGRQDTVLGTQWAASISGPGTTAPADQPAISRIAQASLTYVSGAHQFKVGFQDRWGWSRDTRLDVNGDIRQQYSSGRAFQVQAYNTPIDNIVNVNADLGVFVQDTWTTRRLTLSPGIRYDYFNSEVPEQTIEAGRFVPARHFDAIPDVPNWKNVSPRLGASYDLFGNGKTAIKGTVGVYVQSQGPGFASTYNPEVFQSDQRSWTDTNKDDIAQESELGRSQNLTFGVRRNTNPDPNIKRPYQRVYDVGIQREVRPGFAVSISYNQRSFYNIPWTDNLAFVPSDYALLSVPDPRGNGQTLPVYNISAAKFGQVNELDTHSDQNTRVYKGVDVSLNMRLPRGGTISGGTSTGRTLTQTCQVEDLNNLRFCDQTLYDVPLRTSFKLVGSYQLPYGVRVSANFQSVPGTERIITYQVNRQILPALVPSSVNIRLNEPGTAYNDRVNQLDFSLAKSIRSRGVELRPELTLFNALNANPVLTQTNTFGATLNNAVTIQSPRLIRFGATVKF